MTDHHDDAPRGVLAQQGGADLEAAAELALRMKSGEPIPASEPLPSSRREHWSDALGDRLAPKAGGNA